MTDLVYCHICGEPLYLDNFYTRNCKRHAEYKDQKQKEAKEAEKVRRQADEATTQFQGKKIASEKESR
jgi:hypothetical protein